MSMKDRIAEAIDSTGLKDSEFANRLGRSKGVVTQWRDGTIRSLKADTALAMQELTGYRAAWLISGKGPKLVDAPKETQNTNDGGASEASKNPDGSIAPGTKPTVSDTLANLGELLMKATPKTRDAVADLLSRYAQDPATGQSIAQAIEVLIKGDQADQ